MEILENHRLAKCNEPERRQRPSSSGFFLTAQDVEILHLVFDHRFLRREQISALTGRHEKRLHRRLFKLDRGGYLKTIRLPQQKYIYGLGRAGIEALIEEGIAASDLAEERLRSGELTALFLKHEMMIVDVHLMLTLACSNSAVRLAGWKEGRELYDSVTAVDYKGSNRLPVRPDAFFGLEDSRRPDGANRTHFALEADRSTTTHSRFEEKIRAYWAYIEQGLHEKKFGVKGLRVLTVTLTDARSKNLCSMAGTAVPERARKYFLFAALNTFSTNPDPVGSATCYSPRSGDSSQRYPLVPAPNQLQREMPMM